jgi:hypothetical protein
VLPLETHPSRPRSPNAEIKTTKRKGGGPVGEKKGKKETKKQTKREKARKKRIQKEHSTR